MKVSAFEIASRYVLPSLKRRLAEIMLKEYGFTQKEIARILGVSEAAVSRYISGERGYYLRVENLKEVDEKLRRIAEAFRRHEADTLAVHYMLHIIAAEMMAEKRLCTIHRELDENINPAECNICPKIFGISTHLLSNIRA